MPSKTVVVGSGGSLSVPTLPSGCARISRHPEMFDNLKVVTIGNIVQDRQFMAVLPDRYVALGRQSDSLWSISTNVAEVDLGSRTYFRSCTCCGRYICYGRYPPTSGDIYCDSCGSFSAGIINGSAFAIAPFSIPGYTLVGLDNATSSASVKADSPRGVMLANILAFNGWTRAMPVTISANDENIQTLMTTGAAAALVKRARGGSVQTISSIYPVINEVIANGQSRSEASVRARVVAGILFFGPPRTRQNQARTAAYANPMDRSVGYSPGSGFVGIEQDAQLLACFINPEMSSHFSRNNWQEF